MNIEFKNSRFLFDQGFELQDINWHIAAKQHWVITGANGSGKSALVAALADYGDLIQGTLTGVPKKVALVSFEAQAELIEQELKKDDADIMDVIAKGTTVAELLAQEGICADIVNKLITKFELNYLLERAFRALSTGETRKILLIRALASQPDLLLLDEPFDGLDAPTALFLQEYLLELSHRINIIMVLNRWAETPDFITHIGYMSDARLQYKIDRNDQQATNELLQLLHLKTTDLSIPPTDADTSAEQLKEGDPLVKLTDICIKYDQLKVVEDFNNDIFVFGYQRGNGESIWQIKQHIGYVSTALQWQYRVGTSLRNVIVSGFYDSIGLYGKATDTQRSIADQWLALLGMAKRADESFSKQSFGDQRLLLIARSMVKHPPLLILDEPCLGLDDMNRQLVLALIEKICAAGKSAVLYVNHHSEDAIAGIDLYKKMSKHPSNLS